LIRALAQSPDGIAVLDLNGVYLYVNPAWEKIHGFRAEDSIGHTDDELYLNEASVHNRAEGSRRMEGKESAEFEFNVTRSGVTPMRVRLIMTKIRDEAENHTGYLVTSRDVTEPNRLKQALEDEKARLNQQYQRQKALASIQLAINEPDELATAIDQIVEIVTELLPASGGASILLGNASDQTYTVSASSASGQLPPIVTRWIIDNRKPVVVSDVQNDPFETDSLLKEFGLHAYVGVPLLSDNLCLGVLYALDTAPRDYSANDMAFLTTLAARASTAISKVQLYEQLREANRILRSQTADLAVRNADLDAFAHSVAHDLKNPLTTIMGFAEMLLDDYGLLADEERKKYMGIIAQRGVKMRQIVDELLLMSQLRNQEVQLSPLNMQAIVDEALQRLDTIRRERGAIVHIPDSWPPALGYAQWMEEVWANYLSNALKYGGRPPEIWLGASEDNAESVRFWVKDNGPGLSAEDQKLLFLPFTRLQTSQEEGHGLGLSIVKRIVEKCQGRVGVESTPGAGSTFWFTLPRAKE